MDKFEIEEKFRAGFVARLARTSWHDFENCKHGMAGWRAANDAYHASLNQYLNSIGSETMGVVRLAGNDGDFQ